MREWLTLLGVSMGSFAKAGRVCEQLPGARVSDQTKRSDDPSADRIGGPGVALASVGGSTGRGRPTAGRQLRWHLGQHAAGRLAGAEGLPVRARPGRGANHAGRRDAGADRAVLPACSTRRDRDGGQGRRRVVLRRRRRGVDRRRPAREPARREAHHRHLPRVHHAYTTPTSTCTKRPGRCSGKAPPRPRRGDKPGASNCASKADAR